MRRGSYVTLYMNPDTMDFKQSMFIPGATSAIGKLCPNQRRVPQLGSLFAEMFVMPVLIVRLPLVILVSSPVLVDLIAGDCYADSKSHSLLMNCGSELFSLEQFFDSAYRCNSHFWRILSITANFLPPGFVQTFINGVAAVGENSGASSFMPGVIGAFSKVGSTDAGDSAETVQDTFGGGGDGGKMSRFGAAKLFMKAAVNPIAGTHWMWRMGSRMIVQIIQATQQRRSVGSVFWNILYDGRLDYKQLVATRMFNTCGGMALMAGYTSPLGKVTLHYCFAGVKSTTATLDLVSVFLVDIPVMACVCKQGEGRNARNWIYNHCESPDGLRPLLRTVMDKRDQCGILLQMTNKNLTGVFDDVFGEMFAGTTYIGSILDSLVAAIDPGKAGNCDNFDSNPYVVTLIPEPADYWRVCGTTSFCKLRCQQQIEAFEMMKPSAGNTRSSSSSQVVESLLFPSINQDTYNPFLGSGIVALTEMSDCSLTCPAVSTDRCLIIAGFPGNGRLLVSTYCVPSSIARGVSKSQSWESPGISGQCTDIQFVSFGVGGEWLKLYGVVGLQDQLIQACFNVGCQEFAPTDLAPNVLGFEQMQALDSYAIVQVRTTDSGYQSYKLMSTEGRGWWFTPVESNVWDQDLYHVVITSQESQSMTKVLLIPYAETPLQVCFVRGIDGSANFDQCTQFSDFERQNVPVKTRGKQARVSRYVRSKNPKAFTIFLTSNDASHWLRILSLDLSGTKATASTKASIPAKVTTTNVQSCSLNSCIGCTRLAVQRLCFAAQQCQVARCIGSQVNQLRPLCAVGGITESSYFAMLSGIQGVWSIIASTLVTIIQASGGLDPPKSIDWPDQVFYGLVCSMKDIVASQISVITSTVNGIIQASVPIASAALGEPVDNKFLAMFSLTMTSVTNFLFQLSLAPLYAAIAAQKVMVCQANSLVGIVAGDNHISIGDPEIQTASSAAAGICMTQVFTENAQGTNSGMDNDQASASGSSQLLLKLGGLALSLPLDAMKHPLDVLFTYAQGVILGLQDILQTVDQRNCRAPDFTTRVLYKCPCGDQPVQIPEYRQNQTYRDGAYWCSTVMSMLDFDGSVKYVWNPFSLYQLKAMLGDFDVYLECVASRNDASCAEMTPKNDVFEQQQISLLSVYQRCLTNYQEMTWDQGTFVLFNKTLQSQLFLDRIMPIEVRDMFNVSKCLLEQRKNGYDNVGCLVDYFLKGQQAMDYFEYGNITDDNPASKKIDACLTFSGPATLLNDSQAAPFQACLESHANRTGCNIPHMLWSGRSTNKVPVATQHSMKITEEAKRKEWAMNAMKIEQDAVLRAIKKLEKWSGSDLRISVFSAEGDILHQFADCVIMGPLSSATLTPGPDTVEKVVWSRRSGESRLFDLPCSGSKLVNRDGRRDTQPPYTCGTYARKAVIKYYLRNKFGGMNDSEAARNIVVEVVKAMINRTKAAWELEANFQCTCKNGSKVGWECCTEQNQCATDPCPCPAGFDVTASVACCKSVCGGLAGNGLMEAFSYINGSAIAADLLEGMGGFMQNDIWTFKDPWLMHDPLGEKAYKDSWEAAKFEVTDMGLFDTTKPVSTYEEFNYPLKNTMWQHCAGLLQQVMWTMPVDSRTDKPKIPDTMYNPMSKSSNTINITYTEEFIQALTLQAYKSSPVYWHYQARYTPSSSEVCERNVPRVPLKDAFFSVGNRQARRFGFSSLTLGGAGGADCYCGWWNDGGTACKIPGDLCDALVQIVGFLRVCIDQKGEYDSTDHTSVLEALEILMERQPSTIYPCPSLQISDHWGFIETGTGLPLANSTREILTEGVGGFRKGNTEWIFDTQNTILNPKTRKERLQTSTRNVALQCNAKLNPSIADHFVDELFPVAQGVRQSAPITYCTRYGIELARLTVYKAAGLDAATGQQEGVVDKWKARCQYKLEELAVCNLHKITKAYNTSHMSTAHCPFSVEARLTDGMMPLYSVTPGCLLIIWNTVNRDGIYDPCICLSTSTTGTCAGTFNGEYVAIPTVYIPSDIGPTCLMQGLQDLVNDTVIPGETGTGVPLGGGSFASLMDKDQRSFKVNTQERAHWTLHKEIMDADYLQDWWPDEWKFPAGYHVTPGCSRDPYYQWKTFNSSWRWDPAQKKMVFSKDETNDPLLRRNVFGATGVCRMNNYGMPMTGLNTMVTCTKENADAKTDPMVPSPGQQAWVDGKEYCAPDSSATPWAVNMNVNPPRQWTVGTLQQEADGLSPLDATEWGPGCGPYPVRTCRADPECVTGLKCMKSMSATVGVCAKPTQTSGKFDCTEHSQCTNDQMCAGDGKCVDGYWKVKNNLKQSISFRTHSQRCNTGTATSTWGTSVAENVPDILKSSGMCSFRSWYENKKMAEINGCTQGVCTNFRGMFPWNFTEHISQNSAFDDEILKVKAHPCDREYQYYEGFMACTPNTQDSSIFNPLGQLQTTPLSRDTRTRTYRPDKTLTLLSLTRGEKTRGFTGIPKTYGDLKLGSETSEIQPCSKVNVCGLQPGFTVNGKIVTRLVLDNGVARAYTVVDMIKCGSFGFIASGQNLNLCQIDYAVVPLAKVYRNYISSSILDLNTALTFLNKVALDVYTPGEIMNIHAEITQLPGIFINKFIGGVPDTLSKYLDGVEKFTDLHGKINEILKPLYEEAGTPKQIYYVTKRGVYEVPFAWWFRCSWLKDMSMDRYEISSDDCPYIPVTQSQSQAGIVFAPYSSKLKDLLGVNSPESVSMEEGTLRSILQRLPGVVSKESMEKVADQYKKQRDFWLGKIRTLLGNIIKKCYFKQVYVSDYSRLSDEYQLQQLNNYQTGSPFNLDLDYKDANNQTVCSGRKCLRSEYPGISTFSTPTGFGEKLIGLFTSSGTQLSGEIQLKSDAKLCNGNVCISDLVKSDDVLSEKWTELKNDFPSNSDECKTRIYSTTIQHNEAVNCICASWGDCTASLKRRIIDRAKIPEPSSTSPSTVTLVEMGESKELKVCSDIFGPTSSSSEECFTDPSRLIPGKTSFSNFSRVQVQIGISLEAFHQGVWDCALYTCEDVSNKIHNKLKPRGIKFPETTINEAVRMTEYSYHQKTFVNKAIPWTSQTEETAELNLYKNENSYCRPPLRGSTPDRSMPFREVNEGFEFKLKVYKFEYIVNGDKAAELETFPCAEDEDIPAYTGLKQSDFWPQFVGGGYAGGGIFKGMSSFNTYRADQQKQGFMCNMSGPGGLLPHADELFKTSVPRSNTIFLGGISDREMTSMEDVAKRIQNVITSVQSNIKNNIESCLETPKGCYVEKGAMEVSVSKINDPSSKEMQDFCEKQMKDRIYGCKMFPGEWVTKYQHCERYGDTGFARWKCEYDGDPFPCTKSQYYKCLKHDENDKCYNSGDEEEAKTLRNMRPTGRKFFYDLSTTTSACVEGEPKQCKLSDEDEILKKYSGKENIGFCPSEQIQTAQRSLLYNQMSIPKTGKPRELNTLISNAFTLPDEENRLDFDFGENYVDHLYMALDPAYTCSASVPRCPASNQMPIEVRSNLWRCAQCPLVSNTYCTGQHNCLMESAGIPKDNLYTLDGWDNLTSQERAFLTESNGTIDVAVSSVRWLVNQTMRLAMTGVGVAPTIPDFMRTYIGESSFSYSPQSIITYSNDMDVKSGTCTQNGVMPDFTNCSYDGNRRRLKDFINSATSGYKVTDGVIVDPGLTLVWKILKPQMVSQNIPMWLLPANKSGMFWKTLFDDKWCKRGNPQDNACYITVTGPNTVVEVLNPGLLGEFEPLVGCDTKIVNGQRVINAMCPVCPKPLTSSDVIDLLKTESPGQPMPCPSFYKAVSGVTSNTDADSNLCGKTPAYESTCSNLQGMLGQTTYDGSSIRNVYDRIPWKGGLPPGINENPLFKGAMPGEATSNLILKLTDIGGHCIGIEITQTSNGPTMSIVELPLASYTTKEAANGVKDSTRLKWIQIPTARELDKINTVYPNSVCNTWDCPLRRRAFYTGRLTGKDSPFRPMVPDPLRTHVLFGSRVHPTQIATPIAERLESNQLTLGFYYTSNGFCACTSRPCVCPSDEDALTGNWQTAIAAPSGCSNQIDWPYTGGTLRDDSSYGSNLGASTCGILDRLPVFKYRYVNTKKIAPSTLTTLDKGGVCYMGWPVELRTPLPAGCHIPKDKDYYVCPKISPAANTLNRLRAKTITELLTSRQRPSLKDCEAPPKYTTSTGTEVNPEVSYGTLKRLETSRMLAIDLRRKLCGNSSHCTPSKDWELDSFWNDVFMKDFPHPPKTNGANQTLWNQPWVACLQHSENQTQTCEGTISRETWIKGNRTNLCLNAIKSTSIAEKLAQPINVCDLDQDMDYFCRAVQDARYKVFEANCLFSGQCRQKLFFYQPSTYSVNNAQFVRSTVQQFYDSTVSGSCIPDLDTAAAIRANADNLKNCAALTLTTLADCLQIVRVIMDALVEIVFYVGNLFLYVFQMLAVNDRPELRLQIIQQINAILLHIKNSFLQLFNAFGDLIYKVIFDGPMGKWIMTIIIKLCEVINWIFNEIIQRIVCWAKAAIIVILDSWGLAIVNILDGISFGKLGYLKTDLRNAKKNVETSITCTNKNPLNCNISFRSDPPITTTLPLATRCWAGAEPGINSFACTAADTCLNDDFSKIICGACPKTTSMIQFGCNTLTKLCSCNIFSRDTTFCSSHEECTMESDNVECEFVDSYLEPSYGHIPCKQCPKPMCLITDGSGVGKCTCLLRPIPNQGCVGLGERVSPSASSLCLVTTAGGGQSSSATYTQTYRTLASVPCMLINQAASYCMQVYTSATSSAPMVVGLALLKTSGRRLLQNGSFAALAPLGPLISNASVWEGVGEPCRSLVTANESNLGILERYTLGECWRWRDIGAHLVAETNMTHVNPTFLVSWHDLLDTMLSEGAVPEILDKIPRVIHSILLHTEMAQPIYVALLYWSSYLPSDIWSNHTVLDKVRTYLMNQTEPTRGGRRLLFKEESTTPTKKMEGIREWDDGPYAWMPNQIYWNLPGQRRRLLSAQETPPAQVQSVGITADTVYEWSQGPYTWPPNFQYWRRSDSCALVSTAVGVVKTGLDVTMKYYQTKLPEPGKLVWPSLPLNNNINLQFSVPNTTDFGVIIRNITDQVLNKSYIDDFLDTAPYAAGIKSLVQCNFTRIQTCDNRYDLFWSTVMVLVMSIGIGIIGRLLEIPYIEGIIIIFFIPMVMYTAYGYALTCSPLIPVCALRDLLSLLDSILPEIIEWPTALVTTAKCREISCMRSCINEPDIGFASWYDHLAWIMCETDAKWCNKIAMSLASDDPLKEALGNKYLQGVDPDSTRAARGICFVVTLANSAPSFLTALFLLSLIPSLIGVCVSGAQFASNTIFSFVIYVHGNRDD